MTAFLIAALHLWADPACQPLCLYGSVCRYDFANMYCEDSRVKRLGEWDVSGPDYKPKKEYEYGPLWAIPYPKDWGYYTLEQRPTPSYGVRSHGEVYE